MGNKLDTNAFIERAIQKHGDKYDYSETLYVNYRTKVIVRCKKHGSFLVEPREHLRGSGCRRCFIESQKHTTDTFIEFAKSVHGNVYDYSKVRYRGCKEPVTILCKIHGGFTQMPYIHLAGSGCQRCYEDTKINTTDKFIKKARSIHGEKYDYSKSYYIKDDIPITISCPIHGEFNQRKQNHLSGAGCPKCAKQSCSLSTEDFFTKAKIVHGDKYDYSKSKYIGIFSKITIICRKHGEFRQIASNHINNGVGCPHCAKESQRSTTDEFKDKARMTHGEKYDYSQTTYTRAIDKVIIICPTHGEFAQKANNHLNGQGCPNCLSLISKPQQEITNYLSSITNAEIITNHKLTNKCELDIYLPQYHLAIEYHGLYWHSFQRIETPAEKNRHQYKALEARNNNIMLMQIWEHEWCDKQDIIKSMLAYKANKSRKVNARSLNLRTDINPYNFYEENHLQGGRHAKYHYCLLDHNRIIMAASFNINNNAYELIRMATAKGYCVRGGASRIFSHIKHKDIFTYADMRYSRADAYKIFGFELEKITKPGYFYYHENSKQIKSRQQCQKHKLHTFLENFDRSLTEPQNMFNNGYRRAWDAGHMRLRKKQ